MSLDEFSQEKSDQILSNYQKCGFDKTVSANRYLVFLFSTVSLYLFEGGSSALAVITEPNIDHNSRANFDKFFEHEVRQALSKLLQVQKLCKDQQPHIKSHLSFISGASQV